MDEPCQIIPQFLCLPLTALLKQRWSRPHRHLPAGHLPAEQLAVGQLAVGQLAVETKNLFVEKPLPVKRHPARKRTVPKYKQFPISMPMPTM
jgi:hypothetical protein